MNKMPKIKKELSQAKQMQLAQQKMDRSMMKRAMFKATWITYLFAGICLVFSILLQLAVIDIPNPDDKTWLKVIIILLKGGLIILFFFFMFVSMGNMKELRGYIMTWKEMVFLLVISLFQTITDGYVLLVAVLGIIIVIAYFYFLQGKIDQA
jgi:hypothetical protein